MSARQPYLSRLGYLFITGIVVGLLWVGTGWQGKLRAPSNESHHLPMANRLTHLALAEFAVDLSSSEGGTEPKNLHNPLF